jgi:putative heme iron utilization protein
MAASTAVAAEPANFCAAPADVARVRAELADKAPGPLGGPARKLGLPEAMVASALPADQAHGVAASHFPAIWKSLEQWQDAVTLVTKGADVFEILGPVGEGSPSTRSKFFNLKREGPGLAGHLRPDLYSVIYVLSVPGKDGGLRGVSFHSQSGEAVFAVFVPGEGATPPPAVIKQFDDTQRLIRTLPSVCPVRPSP